MLGRVNPPHVCGGSRGGITTPSRTSATTTTVRGGSPHAVVGGVLGNIPQILQHLYSYAYMPFWLKAVLCTSCIVSLRSKTCFTILVTRAIGVGPKSNLHLIGFNTLLVPRNPLDPIYSTSGTYSICYPIRDPAKGRADHCAYKFEAPSWFQ